MIKKFSDWFIRQTFAAKISLVVLALALVIAGIFQLSNITTPQQSKPTPTQTSIFPTKTSTPQPTSSESSAPIGDKIIILSDPSAGGGDGLQFTVPYTIDQMYALNTFTHDAAIQQCKATAGESDASIVSRISPYFQNPADLVKQGYFYTDNLDQGCTVQSTDPLTYNVTQNVITYSVTAIKYFVAPDQANLPADKRLVQRANATYVYQAVLQTNDSWIITGLASQ